MPTTTTIALSGQFHKTVIGGVDLSPYFDEIQLTYQRDMIDITVFALGGGAHVHQLQWRTHGVSCALAWIE